MGDNPYMRLGLAVPNKAEPYNMYIKGYEYALYAVMAEGRFAEVMLEHL